MQKCPSFRSCVTLCFSCSPLAAQKLKPNFISTCENGARSNDRIISRLQPQKLIRKTILPGHRFVKILFDQVELKSTLWFSGGHIVDHAENSSQNLASTAVVTKR